MEIIAMFSDMEDFCLEFEPKLNKKRLKEGEKNLSYNLTDGYAHKYISRGVMPLSKITQKRQVVIPEEICRVMGAKVGDYIEFLQRNDEIIIKPKKLDCVNSAWPHLLA